MGMAIYQRLLLLEAGLQVISSQAQTIRLVTPAGDRCRHRACRTRRDLPAWRDFLRAERRAGFGDAPSSPSRTAMGTAASAKDTDDEYR